jgi:hypothetical protein
MPRGGVTIDGVLIGYLIYRPLTGGTTNKTIAISTLHKSLLHTLVPTFY